MYWSRRPNVWLSGLLTWDSLRSSKGRGLTGSWHALRSIEDERSISRPSTLKTHFLARQRMGEVIGLGDKCVHEHRRDADVQFFYQNLRLLSITVWFKADICQSSFHDGILATHEALGNVRQAPSSSGVFVPFMPLSVGDEGDWDSRDMPAGLCTGREQRRV